MASVNTRRMESPFLPVNAAEEGDHNARGAV
jgi:hypothetical protein